MNFATYSGSMAPKPTPEAAERVLRAWDADAVDACLAADDLPGLLAAHAPFAMRRRGASADEYLASHDPMAVRANVSVPTLLLNAEDDFVCPVDLARPDVVCSELPGTLLLITKEGSHVAFNEGRLGRKSFHARVSFDFLDAARETGMRHAVDYAGRVAEPYLRRAKVAREKARPR